MLELPTRLVRLATAVAVVMVVGSAQAAGPAPATGWSTFGGAAARTDDTTSSVASPKSSWFTPLPGMVTTQPLVVRGVPQPGAETVYVATADGFVYALASNGYVRWRVDLGRQPNSCPQIPDGWGVTGTPVVDRQTSSLYVVDAFGRLHALDLATGREHAGWPIVLYSDYRNELDWGASILVDGSVYVPTGSFCDLPPMEGKLIRVELATKQVTSWVSVPPAEGGGGSVWGWGGPAYSAKTDSLYVGTGNTFEGGSNTGSSFSEQAGYGEHVVQLSRSLTVLAASKPDLGSFPDNGVVGSPVIVDPPGCGELVAAQTKSGAFIGWRADALAAGPIWQLQVQKANPATPLLTQPAFSAKLDSFFVVTWTSLVRLQLGSSCRPHVAWTLPLGQATLEGSPTVAGNEVWLALSGPNIGLVAVNAVTGRRTETIPVGGISFTPPSVVDGELFMGAAHGFSSRPFPVSRGESASALPGYSSASDPLHRWESREDGVYSSDDGGRHWHRIYPDPAVRVVRTSTDVGVIAVGSPAPACNCSTTRLLTVDGGRTWEALPGIGQDFEGRGSAFYWWSAGALYRVDHWPPGSQRIVSRRVAETDGPIVSAVNIPGGLATLVDRRTEAPQVILSEDDTTRTVTLPDAGDAVVPRTLSVAWPTLTVHATDYSAPSTAPDPSVTWQSSDGGTTWTLNR